MATKAKHEEGDLHGCQGESNHRFLRFFFEICKIGDEFVIAVATYVQFNKSTTLCAMDWPID